MPKNGTMSTCNQFSTTEPTAAPTTRPPMVITVAFPAEEQITNQFRIICKFCGSNFDRHTVKGIHQHKHS